MVRCGRSKDWFFYYFNGRRVSHHIKASTKRNTKGQLFLPPLLIPIRLIVLVALDARKTFNLLRALLKRNKVWQRSKATIKVKNITFLDCLPLISLIFMKTRKTAGFKSLRLNCWNITQAIKKCKMSTIQSYFKKINLLRLCHWYFPGKFTHFLKQQKQSPSHRRSSVRKVS